MNEASAWYIQFFFYLIIGASWNMYKMWHTEMIEKQPIFSQKKKKIKIPPTEGAKRFVSFFFLKENNHMHTVSENEQ